MSGAVPADEFEPAYFGYMLITPLFVIALILFLSQVFIAKMDPGIGNKTDPQTLIGLANLLVVAGVFSEYLALIGVFLLLWVSIRCQEPVDADHWPSIILRGTARDVWRAWLPFLLVTILLGLGELSFFTSKFFADGILEDALEIPFAMSLTGFATLSALKALFVLLRIVIPGFIAFILLRKITPRVPHHFDLIIGVIVGANLFHLFWQTMRDELLGLEQMFAPYGSILALFVALIGLGALALAPIFKSSRQKLQGASATGFGQFIALPFLRVSPSVRFLQFLTLAVLLFGFRYLLYPVVEDYRTKLFDTFAQMAIVTGVLLLLPFGRLIPHKILTGLAIVLTAIGIYSTVSYMQRPDVRLVAFEYSRFCALGASAPWAKWVESKTIVGFDQPKLGDPFPSTVSSFDGVARKKQPPIFLIIWDAARPDHMSAYGYNRRTTPHLEELVADGVIFNQARSTATATTLGIRNMMTGCYSTRFMLSQEHGPFFVKNLAEADYNDFFITVTGNDYNGVSADAFQRSWSTEKDIRFHFRNYSNTDELKPDRPKSVDLLDFIDEQVEKRGNLDGCFHYVHLTGTHSPWLAKDEVRHFGDSAVDKYDGEMAKVDYLLGQLVEKLKKHELYEEAIIIVTADHGTGLGEHGRLGGFLPYEEQVRIPLVIKGPFKARGKTERLVGNIDIGPTLLELVGAPVSAMDGASSADLLLGIPRSPAPRAFVTFCAFRDGYAVYDPAGRYKLHHYRANGYEALFDLKNDPQEKRNLIMVETTIAHELRLHLDHFLWRGKDRYGNPFHYRDWDLKKEKARQK